MPATRTQIYITESQRRKLDAICRHERSSLAAVIRRAIDAYLAVNGQESLEEHFARTAGTIPDLEVPSRSEWDRDHRWR